MKSFQHKRGWRNIMHSRPVLFFLIVLIFVFAWGVFRFMGKMKITIENKEISQNKLIELQKEKDKLSLDISKLQTENGVEESIRDKFGLVKEGEGVIIVVEDKDSSTIPKKDSNGFLSFFLNWFK